MNNKKDDNYADDDENNYQTENSRKYEPDSKSTKLPFGLNRTKSIRISTSKKQQQQGMGENGTIHINDLKTPKSKTRVHGGTFFHTSSWNSMDDNNSMTSNFS